MCSPVKRERRCGRHDVCMLPCSKWCSGKSSRLPGRFLYDITCMCIRDRPSLTIRTACDLRAPCRLGCVALDRASAWGAIL
eukprot:564083-Prymnesium_polylepis.1